MQDVIVKRTKSKGKGLFANRNFKKGEKIVSFQGPFVSKPTRHTLQIDWEKHINVLPPAKFLNHFCNPNTGIKINKQGRPFLQAMRNIKKGEEITFNYAMSEYEMTPKMSCRCGSKNCRKLIGGFKFLDSRIKKRYEGFIKPYLLKTLLLATTNPGKVLEYKEILKDLPIEVVTLKDLGLENIKIEEDGKTFEENAIKKAKVFCQLAKLPVLADDGGIEIDYLKGEPGVKSRRWPGYEASDGELIRMILEKLKGVPSKKRGAQLRAIIALAFPGDKKIYTFEGVLRGRITKKPLTRVIAGYPFRSVFYLPEIKKVLGKLTMKEEARIAHRKKAIEKAIPLLKEKLCST